MPRLVHVKIGPPAHYRSTPISLEEEKECVACYGVFEVKGRTIAEVVTQTLRMLANWVLCGTVVSLLVTAVLAVLVRSDSRGGMRGDQAFWVFSAVELVLIGLGMIPTLIFLVAAPGKRAAHKKGQRNKLTFHFVID